MPRTLVLAVGILASSCWMSAALAQAYLPTRALSEQERPSYFGTLDARGSCDGTHVYSTVGFAPDDGGEGGPYPLFLYFVGTTPTAGDLYDTGVPLDVTEAMAARGFVALSVSYDNTWTALFATDRSAQLRCLFTSGEPNSLIAKACQMPNVDCDRGIATWGHSQGGLMALKAYDLEPHVRASWAAGVGTDVLPFNLDRTRVRVLNGSTDVAQHTPAAMGQITGAYAPADCPQSSSQCLRADKSGWVVVPAVSGLTGGHCWFMQNGCFGDYSSAPAFLNPNPQIPYTLAANADWIQATVSR
jgi:hypothetical protein